jgi:hypothetical protein
VAPARAAGLKAGYRSGYESTLVQQLTIPFEYEAESFKLTIPVRGHKCTRCGTGTDVVRVVSYTPDFFLETGWIVEAKGKFTPKDRKLALAFKEQYPDRKYALSFQRDNYLTKKRSMRYSEWASKNDIPWVIGGFRQEWVT